MVAVALENAFLTDDQLQPGDLMLKYSDGSALSGIISFGQRVFQGSLADGNTKIVHAGIMLDGLDIIESQGSGVSVNDLQAQNLNYGYEVYRCLLTNVAEMASVTASTVLNCHLNHKTAKYSIAGAVGSLFGTAPAANESVIQSTIHSLSHGKGYKFFCSQFVVLCYQFAAAHSGLAAQSLFKLNSSGYSPTKLKDDLSNNPYFYRAGKLTRGIRISYG